MRHEDSQRGPPEAQPLGERSGGGGSSTPPTAIGVQTPGREFLIVNDTYYSCSISCDSELVIELGEREEGVVDVGQVDTLTVTPMSAAPILFEVEMRDGLWGVMIRVAGDDLDTFELRPLERRPRPIALPRSADIMELNILTRTYNALRFLSINTVDDALQVDVDAVLALRRYPLFTLFDLAEQIHDLLVL